MSAWRRPLLRLAIVTGLVVAALAAVSGLWVVGARASLTQGAKEGARYAVLPLDPIDCAATDCHPGSLPSEDQIELFVRQRTAIFGVDGVSVAPPPPRGEGQAVDITVWRAVPEPLAWFTNRMGLGETVTVSAP